MDNQDKPKIILMLDNANSHSDSVKIRARAKKPDGFTVYFDYYSKGKRDLKYLNKKLHLSGTPATLATDKEKLRIIIAMRDQLQNDQLKSETGFSLSPAKGKDFLIYFESVNRSNANWNTARNHFKSFADGKKITFEHITRSFCTKYFEFLQSRLKQNSAVVIYQKFKAVLNKAVKDDLITKNPATTVVLNKPDTKREFLTLEEIKTLSATPKTNFDTCNAFLFSCFTGLRLSDVINLTFDQVKDGYIEFKQQKTGQNERLKLSNTALKIFEEQKNFCRSSKVFDLQALTSIKRHLKQWILESKLSKHITFHCARHSFATLALTNDIDLYTVSKLLGHRDIKTTQIYAKLIDKKKDEAIDKLPEIDILKSEM